MKNEICKVYDKVKYWCLDELNRPYLFAYSALINQTTQKKTIETGFDGCFLAPITKDTMDLLFGKFIDQSVTNLMSENFLNYK